VTHTPAVVDILPTVQYFIARGIAPLTVLNTFPCGFFEHYVSAGFSPEAIYQLVYGPHPVFLRRQPDRRQIRH
jgi:hypothetical protein